MGKVCLLCACHLSQAVISSILTLDSEVKEKTMYWLWKTESTWHLQAQLYPALWCPHPRPNIFMEFPPGQCSPQSQLSAALLPACLSQSTAMSSNSRKPQGIVSTHSETTRLYHWPDLVCCPGLGVSICPYWGGAGTAAVYEAFALW